MVPRGRGLGILALAVLAWAVAPASRAESSKAELEQRVAQLERMVDNQGLLELSRQLEVINAELRSLRGDLEELQFALQGAKEQQRAQYLDLDQRLKVVEDSASRIAAATAADPAAEYQAAFDLLKEGKYAQAGAGFEAFIAQHPEHELASNARYWQAEVSYVERDYEAALVAFGKVLDDYSQARKAPDALLKSGYCLYELKRYAAARAALRRVIDEYPGTGAAKEAEARLSRMAAEGR